MRLEHGPVPYARSVLGTAQTQFRAPHAAGTPLPENFWLIWSAGTFGPLACGILLAAFAGPDAAGLAGVLVVIGIVTLIGNVGLALVSGGYDSSGWATAGRFVALGTGWTTIVVVGAVIALAVLLVIAVVMIFFIVLGQVLSGN